MAQKNRPLTILSFTVVGALCKYIPNINQWNRTIGFKKENISEVITEKELEIFQS